MYDPQSNSKVNLSPKMLNFFFNLLGLFLVSDLTIKSLFRETTLNDREYLTSSETDEKRVLDLSITYTFV